MPKTVRTRSSKGKRSKKVGAPTTQQQFAPIHNQALRNSQRDQAQAQRISQAEEKEFKMDTLKLQRAYVEKKLSLL
mgnify:FL=1|tara:strand:- start:1429 stop:1656 length:228 start_codon:yes stop_codon:yes gene_type:complete